jgi:ABC-type cobalamin/Fe3+-siderophores transport system ATPase subunit
MIEALQLQLASSKDNDMFSLVLLGRNGDGKSTLINLLLSLNAPLANQYGFCGIKNLKYTSSRLNRKEEKELKERLMSHLEALKYLRSGDKDFDEVILNLPETISYFQSL